MFYNIKAGSHLGVVRRWMQRTFRNGDQVTWGSINDVLEERGPLTPYDFEMLAQNIRGTVLKEFNIKDTDHVYKYTIMCTGSGTFLQYADTSKEIWAALFDLEG